MKKHKWLAGYPGPEDWFIEPYSKRKADSPYASDYKNFREAKSSLIKELKDRIEHHKGALRTIRKLKIKDCV